MVGDLIKYDKDTDEPYCPECGEDLTPQEVFAGRCENCSANTGDKKSQ